MLFVKWTIIGLLLLPVAETAVFILVVLVFGWIWAILLFDSRRQQIYRLFVREAWCPRR